MQLIPIALGQSDEALVLWDEYPELSVAFTRNTQTISLLNWGAGDLDGEPCLILYLFAGEQALEILLSETLRTSPESKIEAWSTLWNWKPDLLKIRYGPTPIDKESEVTFLLPKTEGETLIDKLTEFIRKMQSQVKGQLRNENMEFLLSKLELVTSSDYKTV